MVQSTTIHTVQLLHALNDLVDVLPHDVLNVDQTLVDLVVAVQVARLVVVLASLLLDLLVCVSSWWKRLPKRAKAYGRAIVAITVLHLHLISSSQSLLVLVFILQIVQECVLHVVQIRKYSPLRQVLLCQRQKA